MRDINIIRTLLAPRKILFGFGASEKVVEEANQLGTGKILIVTDETVAKLGIVGKVKKPLENEGFSVDVWDSVEPEPTMPVAEKLTDVVREASYELIVGVGGGSSLDMAKVASLMRTNPGRLSDYLKGSVITKRGTPLIAIPTTSGTGSEATATLVVTYEGSKTGVTAPQAMPDIAIVDPNLTLSLPQRVTANTGMDALSHSIEAYMAQRNNSFADSVALESIHLVAENLRLAYSQGGDQEARYHMSMASMLGGLAIANAGTCGGHAVAYGFAVKKQLPHGFSCAVALPYIMEYNSLAIPGRLAEIAEALGEDTTGLSDREAAYLAVETVSQLNEDLGIPLCLEELGVGMEDLPAIAEETVKVTRLLTNNPRTMTREEALGLFERMWRGLR